MKEEEEWENSIEGVKYKVENRNPKMVEIVNDDGMDSAGITVRCKVCGITWQPKIKPDYKYPLGCEVHLDKKVEDLMDEQEEEFYGYRASWECPNGCKPEDIKKKEK